MNSLEEDPQDLLPMKSEPSGHSSSGKYSDRPSMLHEVLMAEYEALGILSKTEVKAVKDYSIDLGGDLGIIPFLEAESKEEKERRRQFELRQIRRYEVMKKLRDVLHRSPGGSAQSESDGTDEDNVEAGNADAERMRAISNSNTAICLSGGGIRSATFCLGVIQGLASLGLLDKFHYLSTVSGGGFIGSWLSAWICRHRDEKEKLLAEKQKTDGEVEEEKRIEGSFDMSTVGEIQNLLNLHQAQEPEPNEVTHLRQYSNYMSPTVGLFSTDTWVLIAVYLRNLLLNWTVIIPLIVASLLLPKLVGSWMGLHIDGTYATVGMGITVLLGWMSIACVNMMRPSLKNYSPFPQSYVTDEIGTVRPVNKVLLFCLAPLMGFALGLTTVWSWTSDTVTEMSLQYYVAFGAVMFVGGYLAGWLIMLPNFVVYWRKKHKEENSGNAQAARSRCEDADSGAAAGVWNSIKHLCKTYLAEPVFSLISGAIGGAILYAVVEKMFPSANGLIRGLNSAEFFASFGLPLILNTFLLAATIFTGLAVRITNDDDREWVTRFGAVLLKVIVGWTVISAAVIFGPRLFALGNIGDSPFIRTSSAIIGALSGLFSVLSGFSSKTPARKDEAAKDWSGYLITIGSSIAAPVAVLTLIIAISVGTTALTTNAVILSFGNQAIWFAIFAVIGCVMGIFININKFSIHSTYRDRLIRAYLGASNRNRLSEANSFTGLDTEADNVEMISLRQKPLHLLNMTLNMVKSANLGWQERKAESFTASALHAGSSQMGGGGNYRDSKCYSFNKENQRSITLGTSAAISGAAVSPNMGYFTQSTAVSFLMVLFNVRLGWWLGNPGQRGNRYSAWKTPAPRWSPLAFFSEAFLQTDDTHPYVYLADGGQFENLGLYEMVLRRCKTIIVCDAGADPKSTFFDMGSAIHKIRVDLGIPIEFESGKEPRSGVYGAMAKVRYSTVDGDIAGDGTLIYIKPTLTGSEPIDIQHYKNESPTFPHETTADQFFSETQFESYRSLGFQMMNSLGGGSKARSIADLIERVRSNLAVASQK